MKKTFLLALLSTFLFSGCASFVRTSATAFHGPAHGERGTIAAVPISDEQRGSLEFKAVSSYVSKKLGEKGYSPVDDPSVASFVFFITYGIDGGRTTVSSVPIFGQTGGGTSYSSGTVSTGRNFGTFNSTTTTMPTYGVVGSTNVSSTAFKRAVNIDIYRKINGGQDKVYEVRATSSGSCGNINAILFNVIDGIFKEFPNVSGKPYSVDVPWNGQC